MKLIKINHSEIYPAIIMDKENGVFEIKGVSLLENGKGFYQPVLDFLDEYARVMFHFISKRCFPKLSLAVLLYQIFPSSINNFVFKTAATVRLSLISPDSTILYKTSK
jgi:hypothetical protein